MINAIPQNIEGEHSDTIQQDFMESIDHVDKTEISETQTANKIQMVLQT